jgi:Protein of unknown function (DUF1761)
MILPPYGGGSDCYDASHLPRLLAERGVAFAMPNAGPVEFLEPGDVPRTDTLVAHALQRSAAAADRVDLAGFSAGGTGALLYTVLALLDQQPAVARPEGPGQGDEARLPNPDRRLARREGAVQPVAGLANGLGWVAVSLGVIYLFEQRPFKLWLINSGYQVVTYAVMGGTPGAWK